MMGGKKIQTLTKQQRAKFPEYVERWTQVGLSTEPLDRAKIERAVALACKCARIEAPKQIVLCGGPISALLTKVTLQNLPDSVRDSVRDSVGASVWDSVRASVWDSVWDSVRDSVWASVGASVGDSVWASVWDSVRASVEASVWDFTYGQHDSEVCAFYEYFRNVLSLKNQTEKITGLFALAHACGWILPYQNAWFVAARPGELHRNGVGQLHHDGGYAISYPDGWGVYSLNGVRVPEWLAVTQANGLDGNKLTDISNAEVRREFIREVGMEKILADTKAKPVSEGIDANGNPLKLYALPGMNSSNSRMYLHMINGTLPNISHLEAVHPDCDSVESAMKYRDWQPLVGDRWKEMPAPHIQQLT